MGGWLVVEPPPQLMRLSCSCPILLYRPPGLKASAMICNALYDILIN